MSTIREALEKIANHPAAYDSVPGLDRPTEFALASHYWRVIGEMRASARAALAEQAQQPVAHVHESWWLIESATSPTLYFSGWSWKLPSDSPPFTSQDRVPREAFVDDASKAIRFPARESAENMLTALLGKRRATMADSALAIFHRGLSCYRVAEHIFDYTPRSAGVTK